MKLRPFKVNTLILLISIMLSAQVMALAPVELSEDQLQAIAKKGSPKLDEIQSALLRAEVSSGETDEKFAPELFGKASYGETNERALVQFQPIFSPTKRGEIGVRQSYKQGIKATASIATNQQSAVSSFTGKFRDVTTTIASFTLQMDLWKDLFGRMSKATQENAALESKRASIENEIQTKTFSITLRRVYWSLVANQESLKISESLLGTAKQQLSESKKRLQNSVAELDEVARYEAQVASREGSIIYLKYQKEALIKQLKNLLPELNQSEITMGAYDLPNTVNQVLACTATIAAQPSIPYDYTKYDEAISLIRQVKKNLADMNSRYSDVDVQLYGTVKSTGVDSDQTKTNFYRGSYGGSIDEMTAKNRSGYEVGLQFALPLGSAKESTQKTKELYDDKRLKATIDNTEAQVISTHQQLVKSISLLTDVVRAQKVNSSQLEKRLNLMKKKYSQARISVDDLISNQDALLSSELTTIDTQLEILNTLFDYLVVYTDTPCPFNRMN